MKSKVYSFEWMIEEEDGGDGAWCDDAMSIPEGRDPESYIHGFIDGAIEFRGEDISFRNWKHEPALQEFMVRWTHEVGGEEIVSTIWEFAESAEEVEHRIADRLKIKDTILRLVSGEIVAA